MPMRSTASPATTAEEAPLDGSAVSTLATADAPDTPVAASTATPGDPDAPAVGSATDTADEAVGHGLGVGVAVGGADAVGLADGVGVGVGVALGVGLGVAPGQAVAAGDAEALGDADGDAPPPRGGGSSCAPAVPAPRAIRKTPAVRQAAPSTVRTRGSRMQHSYPTRRPETQLG